ncbi:ABC transporter permease subunit [Paraburkholderia phytofirmans]|uniref:Glutamate/aspartate import permease protein GltK n=1 Tax=Paraburkholderia phytofirmans (strain DSM 17436 / LMG 22146 / PsJN) TaxID=398527 RepID=B2TA00_PARPJ|nr:ABC transporter permease subunit [Paraburkholderia phytofirmans]ACD21252.1 polar amino acid ABC transporter, inner membrane subunit [Paraburkholderia phytofirmans PsJN]
MFNIDWQALADSKGIVLAGMGVTLQITFVAILCGLLWGTVLAVLHRSPQRAVRVFAQGYVALFRSIPLVMLLLWFFLIVPQFLKALFNLPAGVDVRLISAMVAYSLLEAAFFCEIIRAGIESLPRGQAQAALALGMTAGQTMRYVILPQAFRAMVPVALTQCIVIFQDTSLVYVIALGDFFRRVSAIGERDGTVVPMLLFAGVAYWSITTGLTVTVKVVRTRLAK